jgi:hypothetical protein
MNHPEPTDAEPGQDWLRRVMQALCGRHADAGIADSGNVVIAGVALSVRLDEASHFVQAYAEVGEPPEHRRGGLLRQALQAQFATPAPWSVLPGLHPRTGCLVLHGVAAIDPQAEPHEAVNEAVAMVRSLVGSAHDWRAAIGRA